MAVARFTRRTRRRKPKDRLGQLLDRLIRAIVLEQYQRARKVVRALDRKAGFSQKGIE